MRTVGRDSIVEWKTHLQRINNSVSKISFEGKEEKVKSAMRTFSEFTTLEAKLLPMLKKGLQIYYDEIDDSTGTEHPFEAKVSLMVTYSHEVCFIVLVLKRSFQNILTLCGVEGATFICCPFCPVAHCPSAKKSESRN